MKIKKVAFRKKHRITPPRMQRLVAKGVVVVDSDGFVDEETALAAIERNTSLHAGHQPGPRQLEIPVPPAGEGLPAASVTEPAAPPQPSATAAYTKARAEREQAAAAQAQLRLQETQGELIRVDAIRDALSGELGRLRTRLLSIPAEAAPVLKTKRTEAEMQIVLRGFMIDALSELTLDRAPAG